MTLTFSPCARRAAVFGAAAAAAYGAMVFGTLAELERIAGLTPFDLRPSGYGPQEARHLLMALGETGRDAYLRHQLVLDTLYPALLALTLSNLFRLIGGGVPAGWVVRAGVAASWCAAGFDYAENLGIAVMLACWDDLPDALVTASSLATVAKSVSTSVAVVGLFGLLAWKVWHKRVARRRIDRDAAPC